MTSDSSTIEAAQSWLESVLSRLGIEASVVQEKPKVCQEHFQDFGGTWFKISTDHLSPEIVEQLIGDRGQHLEALQVLMNATFNPDPESPEHIFTLDAHQYRANRYEQLLEMAHQAAEQVRETQQEVVMPMLSSVERKLVHTLFVEDQDLETVSRGQDRDRRLVLCPVQLS
ncbi:Jag family protein [Lyngbya confervoides]|uniref:RNA-binding protein n=1 Tax=Lyngbya confervoides BDU141951 TaxID=1574623 RepID=A0ABD4T948_9CYAN|nr:R3H domain-containing nucleic acid-binding protein [Lyngbya confervoides]MCM1984790.1 RNA-binding protein [Lyngbya confervoides BDU141951]